jgi:hypothetical protein
MVLKMSLHNNPEFNTPEIISGLKAHGMPVDTPSMLSDAFRLGHLSAAPDWKADRCDECDCEFGGADCTWIQSQLGKRKRAKKGAE